MATPGMIPAFLLVLLAFGGWSLLLPVIPLYVVRSGGGDVLAGAATGVFMAVTVATQLLTPALMRAVGYRLVLLAGAALLSGPAALYLLGMNAPVILGISAVRGAGFGLLTVAGSALVAELAPPSRLGRATSLIGLGVGIAELVFLPTGLTLYEHFGITVPAVVASALAVVGVAAAMMLPRVHPTPDHADSTQVRGLSVAVMLWPAMVLMLAVSMSFGAISTYLPAAMDMAPGASNATLSGIALALVGGMVIVGRWLAGARADNHGPGGYLPIGIASATVGIAVMGVLAITEQPSWTFLLPALVFGFGFGAIQNESLLGAFMMLPKSQLGAASAGWNIAFDGGTGLGALVLGLVAGMGYWAVFEVGAVLCLALGIVVWFVWPRTAPEHGSTTAVDNAAPAAG